MALRAALPLVGALAEHQSPAIPAEVLKIALYALAHSTARAVADSATWTRARRCSGHQGLIRLYDGEALKESGAQFLRSISRSRQGPL